MKVVYILLLRVFLLWNTQCIWISDGSTTSQVAITMRNSRENLKILTEEESKLHIRPVITIDVLLGKTTELQCGNMTNKESKWWQTPFGSFKDEVYNDKYPFEINRGNLKISKAAESHTGLYHCFTVDQKVRTISPFKVNVFRKNIPKASLRTSRNVNEISDSHFAAAVASSVLVTFIGAFTLGAFSRPYLIKCLLETRAKICPKNQSHRTKENIFKFATNKQPAHDGTAFFCRGQNSEDDTVTFDPESKAPIKTRNSFRSKQANQDHAQMEEHNSEIHGETNKSETTDASDEPDQTKFQEGENQNAEGVSETGAQIQHKRKSKVIKLYNYDEEGNRYSHIKEPEEIKNNMPIPRQRVMSLTRLNAIMSQAESFDFSSTREATNNSARPDDNPSET